MEDHTMGKFLIEVPHGSDTLSCLKAIQIFLTSGSHFLTHAEWGCEDGEHKAWMIVDVKSKEEARQILPSSYRSDAKIVSLSRFTRLGMKDLFREYHL
jgi:hypothetical protein